MSGSLVQAPAIASPVSDSYDATGQLSTHAPGSSTTDNLTWDAFGRLMSVQRAPTGTGFTWSAVYDGFGRRLQTSETQGTGSPLVIQSSYDPEGGFMEAAVTVAGQRDWLVHGPDVDGGYGDLQGMGGVEAVVKDSNSAATGVFSDMYGHAVATVSGTTVTWNPVRSGSYGPQPGTPAQAIDGTHDLSTLLAWRGRYVDGTGYYYLSNRYYDPTSGTFLSCDPLGHPASMDLYSYCSGDPVNNVDPNGMVATRMAKGIESRADSIENYFDVDSGQYMGLSPNQQASIIYASAAQERADEKTGQNLVKFNQRFSQLSFVQKGEVATYGLLNIYAPGASNGSSAARNLFKGDFIGAGESASFWAGDMGLSILGGKILGAGTGPSISRSLVDSIAPDFSDDWATGINMGAEVSDVPPQLPAGTDYETARLAELGLPKNTVIFRPSSEQIQSAAFSVMVGAAEYTNTGELVGTIPDSVQGGLLEVKGGASPLNSSYQLRLQVYNSVINEEPLTLDTTRPVNPTFLKYLQRWGVKVNNP